MKILIDAHMVGTGEGGNERYIESLSMSLGKIAHVDLLVTQSLGKSKLSKFIRVSKSNILRYFFFITWHVIRGKYDLVLTTYFVSPLVAFRNVIIVHDLLPLRHPEYFSLRQRVQFFFLPVSIYLAKAIIVPSKFIKSEFSKFYPMATRKVRVIHEAANPVFKSKSLSVRMTLRKKRGVDQFSVLVVGSKFEKRPLGPVLEGLLPYGKNIKIFVLQSPANQNKKYTNMDIQYLGNINDSELCNYYNLVDAVIYPSKYEGFGLPILEAMACGTPVIATKIPPVIEIADNVPYYFSLPNPRTLFMVVKSIKEDGALKRRKILQGYNVAKSFSWDKTSRETLTLFGEIV